MTVSGAISLSRKKSIALTAVTNSSGNAVFNIAAAGFTAAPICAITCEAANSNLVDARITARSLTSVTVNVQQSATITILGSIQVLAAKLPAPNITVHLQAEEA